MSAITVTDLNNAQLDVNHIAAITASSALTITDRFGNNKKTLAGIAFDAAARLASLGYMPPVAYASGLSMSAANQTVSYASNAYAPIVSALPFTTSGTFETMKFRLIQGVTGIDLATPATVPIGGFSASETQGILDNSLALTNYAALQAYTGRATNIHITGSLVLAKPAGIAGVFRQVTDTTSRASNGGTFFRDALGRGWEREGVAAFGGISPYWWGAVGDGSTDDLIPLQAAHDFSLASGTGVIPAVLLGSGVFGISASLKVDSNARIVGGGWNSGAAIKGLSGMTAPIITNQQDRWSNVQCENFACIGGSYGIYLNVTTYTAQIQFKAIQFSGQTEDNFYVNKLLQVSNFYDCWFLGGKRGVRCGAFTANLNNFYNCRFGQHSLEDVAFIGASEVNTFYGCSFENITANTANASTLVMVAPNNLHFVGCYFENGFKRVLGESGSTGTTKFTACHFTCESAMTGGQTGYAIGSDGVVTLDCCTAYLPIIKESPSSTLLYSGAQSVWVNTSISAIHAAGVHMLSSKAFSYPASGAQEIMKFVGTGVTTGHLNGTLTINYQSLDAGGFNFKMYYAKYRVVVIKDGGAELVLQTMLPLESNYYGPGPAISIAVSQSGASTGGLLTLKAVFTGATAPTYDSLFSWGFESTGGSRGGAYITPLAID